MPDATPWISATRTSHDRLSSLLSELDTDGVGGPSYASEWSIADTASHLGSQAEIFDLFLAAGLEGTEAPSNEAFGPIWERWNALPPAEQAAQSTAANEVLLARIDAIAAAKGDEFALAVFGMELDLAGVVGMRLGEHAIHTWDVAVALDPTATVLPDAVTLLVDTVGRAASRGTPNETVGTVTIHTTDPERTFVLTTHPEVALVAAPDGYDVPDDALTLPAEAFIRLVFGRLDPDHTPAAVADDPRLPALRTVFPGF